MDGGNVYDVLISFTNGWFEWWNSGFKRAIQSVKTILFWFSIFFGGFSQQNKVNSTKGLQSWVYFEYLFWQPWHKKPIYISLKNIQFNFQEASLIILFFSALRQYKRQTNTTIKPSKKKESLLQSRFKTALSLYSVRDGIPSTFFLFEKKKSWEMKDDLTDIWYFCEVSCSPVCAFTL